MATSSGKKGKKASKKNKVSLGEFLTDGNATPVAQVQVAVPIKLRDWADECDDDEDDRSTRTQMIALPTAPRATRLMYDDTVPHNPPYLAYLSNLPYDLNDDDLYEFFDGMEITSLRLPRDDNDSGRLRGFGYIEFGKRQDLIDALSIPEPVIHTRRIRIDPPSENDSKRQQRNNRNYDNYGGDSDRPMMGNWRDGPRSNADRDQGQRRPYNNYNRDRDNDRERYPDSGAGGNWRSGDRPVQSASDSPPSNRRGYDRGDRGDRGFRRGGDRSGDRGGRREMEPPMERPKLVMKPRTLPLPEKPRPEPEPEESERDGSRERKFNSGSEASEDKENQKIEPRPKPTPVPAAKVFGDAKPVDTAARMKEIEDRMLEKQRLEREERQRKAAAAAAAVASSGDEDGKEKTDPSKDETDEHSEEKTEKKPEEVTNWRVRSDNDKDVDRRGQSPPRRYSPTRKFNRRPDNRDNRDRGMNWDNRNRRDYNRPNDRGYRPNDRDNDMHRGGGGRDNRDDRDRREYVRPVEREHDPKPIEERMPKFHEPEGPNLSVKNTFEGLSADEIDD
ncbi:eukaryotic translation initiation factor 4B isoform X2 [Topomyia yanbarensis]|uniref:eukaryotic translation initiation factor 4B isoform X2 n=1 Tax=Topomyia yanbarensis TaxID=2498891 RepID=UPI00273BF694|nr:eukaryotic translation initiation factor 4B isoform X2 [Topomyia yanbarensis]